MYAHVCFHDFIYMYFIYYYMRRQCELEGVNPSSHAGSCLNGATGVSGMIRGQIQDVPW